MTESNPKLDALLAQSFTQRHNAKRAALRLLANGDFTVEPADERLFRVVLVQHQDAADVAVANERLAEIAADPGSVVRGETLAEILAAKEAEGDGYPHDDYVDDRVTLGDPVAYEAHMEAVPSFDDVNGPGDLAPEDMPAQVRLPVQDEDGGLPETEPEYLVTRPLEERDPEFAALVAAERAETAAEFEAEAGVCRGSEMLAEIACVCGARDGDPCGRGVVVDLDSFRPVLALPGPAEGGALAAVGVTTVEHQPGEQRDPELVRAALDEASNQERLGQMVVAWLLRELVRRLPEPGAPPAPKVKAPRNSENVARGARAKGDPLEKPVITSPTNQGVAKLCDRIEAARGDLAALQKFNFRPSSTYYAKAYHYLQALIAEARAKSEAA